jgi:hypothetical protein
MSAMEENSTERTKDEADCGQGSIGGARNLCSLSTPELKFVCHKRLATFQAQA